MESDEYKSNLHGPFKIMNYGEEDNLDEIFASVEAPSISSSREMELGGSESMPATINQMRT